MMQIVGPTMTAKPYARPTPRGRWWECSLRGGGPSGYGPNAEAAYRSWRAMLEIDHYLRYAHDPHHKLYFPGDPEWKWETT